MKTTSLLVWTLCFATMAVSTTKGETLSGLEVHYTFENADNFGENSAGIDGVASDNLAVDSGPGILGQAADFGTVNDARFLDVLGKSSLDDGAFGFSTWFKTENTTELLTLVHGTGSVSDDVVVVALVEGMSSALFIDRASAPDDYIPAVDGTNLADGLWHHVAVNWSGGDDDTLQLYVDGNLMVLETATLGAFEIDNWSIGKQVTGETLFAGSLDDVRLYNRVLTDGGVSVGETAGGDIAELYAMGHPIPEPGTLVLLVSALALFAAVARRKKR